MNWYPTDNGFVCSTDNGCYYIIRQSGKFRLDCGNGYGKRQSLAACQAEARDIDHNRAADAVASPSAPVDPIAPTTPAPALPGASVTLQTAMAETLEHVTSKPNGVILYRAPSLIDGSPIVVVATGIANKSRNPKTGDMVQTYILADGALNPIEEVKNGARGICGNCLHIGTTCYVNVAQAPLSVWRSLHRGIYPTFNPALHLSLFTGRHLRLGSYGDPAAVPLNVWHPLVNVSAGHTGYTHQWRTCDSSYAKILMASVETIDQRFDAIMRGYRTFRVKLESQPHDEGEFTCPASVEAGKRLSCQECGACHGATSSSRGASPVINFHHSTFGNRFRFRQYEQLMTRILAEEQTGRRVSLGMV